MKTRWFLRTQNVVVMNLSKHHKKMMEVHEDRLTGRRRGTNPVYSSSLLNSPHGPPLLAPRCAAKLLRLRRDSSIRRTAPSSLVVPGGVRDVRRAKKEKNGASWSPVHFQQHIISHHLVFTHLLSTESLKTI